MSKYSLRGDLKKLSYFLTAVIFILLVFAVFCAVVIYPIYLLATSNPQRYSALVLSLIVLVLIYFIVRKNYKVYRTYRSFGLYLLHLLAYFFLPLTGVTFTLAAEILGLRLFFLFLPFNQAVAGMVVLNLLLVAFFFLTRVLFFKVKNYLDKKKHSLENRI